MPKARTIIEAVTALVVIGLLARLLSGRGVPRSTAYCDCCDLPIDDCMRSE